MTEINITLMLDGEDLDNAQKIFLKASKTVLQLHKKLLLPEAAIKLYVIFLDFIYIELCTVISQ